MEARVTKTATDDPEVRGAAFLLGVELADEPVGVPVPEGVLGDAVLLPGSVEYLISTCSPERAMTRRESELTVRLVRGKRLDGQSGHGAAVGVLDDLLDVQVAEGN
jgi:hypothetical protein